MSQESHGKPLVEKLVADRAVVAGEIKVAGDFIVSAGPAPKPGDATNFPAAGVARNKQFVGRTRELAELHRRIARGAVAVFHAVTSDGGFGKSQLAVEYAFRHRKHFVGTWFIDASSAAAADRDGRNVLAALGEPVPAESDAVAGRVAQALSRGRHLLILDDVRDLPAARRQYALADPARLLVTTRRHVPAGEGFDPFPLDVLAEADAVDLLRQGRGDLADPTDPKRPHPHHRAGLRDVAAHLHFHALAVALAGGYLRRFPHVTPPELLERLRQAPIGGDDDLLEGIDPASAAAGYRRGVAATLALHLPTLGHPADDADRLRQRLLAAASLVDPRAIPPDLLLASARAADAAMTPRDAEAALIQLIDVSVLRYGEAGDRALLNIHGLTQQVVRLRLAAANEGQVLLAQAAVGLREALISAFSSPDLEDPSHWPSLDLLSPHAVALLWTEVGQFSEAAWATLFNQFGHFAFNARHRYADALYAFTEAARIYQGTLGGDHPSVGTATNNIGEVLRARGDLDSALVRFNEAERIYRSALGDDHPKLAAASNNIGVVLRIRGDLAGALAKHEEANRINRATYGDSHPNVAKDVNNIGAVLCDRGDLAGAQAMYEEAERIFRAAHGENHSDVAISVQNLGAVLQARGNLDGALAKFAEAERIFRAAYGDNHPNVAVCVNNTGFVLRARGDLDGARAKYEEAERIDRAAFGDFHPKVAIAANNIGGLLQVQGDFAAALAEYREAERIFRTAYGDDHPELATVLNNIGGVLQARGDLAGALVNYQKAKRIDLAVYGDDHPSVARDISSIGDVLRALGDLSGALAKYQEAERIDRAAFGHDHVDVARDVNDIGVVLLACGNVAGAEAKFDEAFDILLRAYGPRGAGVATAAANLLAVGADPIERARAVVGDAAAEELRAVLAKP